jgi:hypothetical protein
MMDPADAFLAHVNHLADNAGIELDDEDLRAIFEESQAGGFNASATEAAFDSHFDWDDDDDDFEDDEADEETADERLIRHVTDDAHRLSAELGRRLTAREQQVIAQGALEQAERYGQVNAEEALDDHYRATGARRPDTNTQEGRGEYYRQRLEELNPPSEPDPDREYDLSNTDDRHAFLGARLNGAEFEEAPGD